MNLGKMLFKTHLVLFLSFFLFFLSSISVANGASYTITTNKIWTLSQSPYVISGEMVVNPGVTLTIEPGVVVKFNYEAGLTVYGTLHVNGTPDQKIYFTSIADDEVGGDTNGDGDESIPMSEDWGHISFDKGSSGIFDNAVIRYGGFSNPVPMTGIFNGGGDLDISRTELSFNGSEGIVQRAGSMILDNSEIHHHALGILVEGGMFSFFYNSIHDNKRFGMLSYAAVNVNAENNWWGDASGPYHPILNPGGLGDEISDGIDFIPWLTSDPLEEPQNQLPQISNLNQFKSDGITQIIEGGVTTENKIVLKALLSDPDNDQVKLQVELKEFNQVFDGNNLLESDFISSGNEALIAKNDFSDENYKWRARAVDNQGGASNWQEFGVLGNVDFEVKLVPLYTQVRSPYPSWEETDGWFKNQYGTGNYKCFDREFNRSTIRSCGCAITSMVMLGRYYDIDTAINNSDVDPGNINTWLTNNKGYASNGNLKWGGAVEYLGFIDEKTGKKMVRFDFNYKTDWNVPSTSPRIDNFLDIAKPIVARSEAFGHYFIIDGKFKTGPTDYTYILKDPAWYNTKRLNQPKNLVEHIQGYNNHFDIANLFSYLKTPKLITSSIHIHLASPAELLITDPIGRRLGKHPITGIVYDEIPDSIYTQEGPIISSDIPLEPDQMHESKVIHILSPIDGEYAVQVIGTDSGIYTLDFLTYNNIGESTGVSFKAVTNIGVISDYHIDYNSVPKEPTIIERIVTIQDVITEIEISHQLNLIDNNGIKNSLIKKLNNAQKQLELNRKNTATNILNAFINEAEAQKGKHIDSDIAELLIKDVQYIIEHL